MPRIEKDSLGEMELPSDALYGIQTQRAVMNFPVTGLKPHPEFIQAYAIVKKCATNANHKAGKIDLEKVKPLIQACDEVVQGKHLDHFIVDRLANITSFNMNVNEVLTNRALEISGRTKGDYQTIHPNDHVNMAQSTNDTFPTTMSISVLFLWPHLKEAIKSLRDALWNKGKEFSKIIKSARTHLQDAVPTSLGREFHAYGTTLDQTLVGLNQGVDQMRIVPIGGTAAGTGMNTPPNYVQDFLEFAKKEGYDLKSNKDLTFIQHSRSNIAHFSGSLRNLGLELIRIANDLRLLSSGPTSGFAEIQLPPVQPGSSIMPGKVNPVMAESLNMLGFQLIGLDSANALAVQAGQLELNVMMPLMIDNLLTAMKMAIRFLPVFTKKCIDGITPNLVYIDRNLMKNPSLATFLNPIIGYEKASNLVKEALAQNKSIKDLLLEKKIITKEQIEKIFSKESILPKKS